MMIRTRYLAAAIAVLTLCVAAAPGDGHPHSAMLTCTNPTSGATWQISIDYDQATVDANAARLSDTEISWLDRKDGSHNTLDLRSGELTVILASSTGGYFLHDHCGLPP
jgi:hypothetical protein